MKKVKETIGILFITSLVLLSTSTDAAPKNKIIFKKGIVTALEGHTIIAAKGSRIYSINAQTAVLKDSRNKRASINQFAIGDQIDLRGKSTASGTIIARVIRNRSIKYTSATRRSINSSHIQAGAINNSHIAEDANISSSKINLSLLNFGTTTLRDGNFTGNWNFNGGNLLGITSLQSENVTANETITSLGLGNNFFGGNVGIGTTNPTAKLSIDGEINLAKNSSEPYACDSSHDGNIALTNFYVTCVCKAGTGWVFTFDGTTECAWQSPGPRHLDLSLSGKELSFSVAANTVIQKNHLTCATSYGYATPCSDTAGHRFIGVAKETVDNTGGANGDKWITLYREGVFDFNALSISQAMVGTSMYVVNSTTMDDASGPVNDIRIGLLVRYISNTEGWVDISD